MAPLELVTFDCAGTLLDVRWSPGAFAMDCVADLGLTCDAVQGSTIYERLYRERRKAFEQVNLSRDPAQTRAWWRQLTEDWLAAMGIKADAEAVMDVADRRLYEPANAYFAVFPDVRPALDMARDKGIRCAVVSNWDLSLHRILRTWDLADRFELIVASLEEGVEKPHPDLFHLTLERLGVPPACALHVGDDPLDDLQGARAAGMDARLLDRSAPASEGDVIRDLRELFA